MGTYITNLNITFSNDTSNRLVSHINLICSLMKHLIFSQIKALQLSQCVVMQVVTLQTSINISTKWFLYLQASEIAIISTLEVDRATT